MGRSGVGSVRGPASFRRANICEDRENRDSRLSLSTYGRGIYREHAGAPDPEPIFETVERFADHEVHAEVTTLLISGGNDDETTPIHFSWFHPDYERRDLPSTPIDPLGRAIEIARETGLRYV